jgi:hypothetical protein
MSDTTTPIEVLGPITRSRAQQQLCAPTLNTCSTWFFCHEVAFV